jgi:hypothetical protein
MAVEHGDTQASMIGAKPDIGHKESSWMDQIRICLWRNTILQVSRLITVP